MFIHKILFSVASGAIASAALGISDPVGDFIPTFAGTPGGDLDVISAAGSFDGTNITLTATMNGAIGTTSGAIYVWGFDRGQGTARFSPAIPNTDNILFDSVVLMRPDTTASITRLVGGGSTPFGAGSVLINGATITMTFAATELPSFGFAVADYTWNLWPRQGTGNNNQISDFAPDNSNARLDSVPEPMTILALAGISGLAALKRKRV